MPFDPSQDFTDVVDGLAPVTLECRDGSASVAVSRALRRAIRTREAAPSGGWYTASDLVWHLPVAELAEAPRLGDVIIDADGRRWTVLDVQHAVLEGRWRCVTRDLAIVHGLDQHVDIDQALYGKSDDGAAEPTWRPWKTAVPARIQPCQSVTTADQGRIRAETRWTIFFGEDLDLDHTHRIRGPDGTVYRILAVRRAERIDALLEIDVAAAGDDA